MAYQYAGKGGGVIQGTASEAVLVVMLAARKRAVEKLIKEGGISEFEALGKLVAYTSDQAHSCVNKASQVHDLYCLLFELLVPLDFADGPLMISRSQVSV